VVRFRCLTDFQHNFLLGNGRQSPLGAQDKRTHSLDLASKVTGPLL